MVFKKLLQSINALKITFIRLKKLAPNKYFQF